jgi:hypothetical protein
MTEERRKLLSILAYFTIIALVAFILFHQMIVKQTRATESLSPAPNLPTEVDQDQSPVRNLQ